MILSDRLTRNLSNTNIRPIIVFQIDGIDKLYTSTEIKRPLKYGDIGLDYGDEALYGGLVPVENQEKLISIDGTTTQIKQTLDPEKGRGSGITSMKIMLIDKDEKATKLCSGEVDGEIIYKRCKVWVGFNEDSSFNSDFILIFRGIISGTNFNQGNVVIELSSPEDQKRQILLPIADTSLNGAISNSVTTIDLDAIDNLLVSPNHPSYSPKDTSLTSYVKIDDEIIKYTGISGLQITGCVRGQLGTTASAHSDAAQVSGFFKLDGHAMDLALKIMLSDADQSFFIENLSASSVNIAESETIQNIFYFSDIKLIRDYNVQLGDWVKSSGSAESANNLSTYTEILDVVETQFGSYILIDPASPLTTESTTTVEIDFLSKYNTLGFGLKINSDDLDIAQHVQLKNTYLSQFDLSFYIREEISEGKSWIENELYVPATCYSLPSDRDGLARMSIGIHKPPLPNQGIITIGRSNILNPDKLSIIRASNKYYYNAVVFRYDDLPDDEKLLRRVFVVSGTPSIPTGNRTRIIDSRGLRENQSAKSISELSASRLLERYQDASEHMTGVNIKFSTGVQITVGDVIILDGEGLNLVNRIDFNRDRPPRFMEVLNRSVDIKSGSISLDLIDTAFNVNAKYGLFSASSKITNIISQKKFVIGPLISGLKYGSNEYRKWSGLNNPAVKIRRADWSSTFETVLDSLSYNTITLEDDVSFTLQEGDIMELAGYSNTNTTTQVKLIYAYFSDGVNDFPDGEIPYQFI